MASIGSDAGKAALVQLDAELVLPPGYIPCLDQQSSSSVRSNESTGHAAGSAVTPQGKPARAGQRKENTLQQQGSVAEELQRLVADVSDKPALLLSRVDCVWGRAHQHMQEDVRICQRTSTLIQPQRHRVA